MKDSKQKLVDELSNDFHESNHKVDVVINKIKERKYYAMLWTLFGVFNFIIFAYDIEMDRDFFTWIWLLTSQLCFLGGIRQFIIYDRMRL